MTILSASESVYQENIVNKQCGRSEPEWLADFDLTSLADLATINEHHRAVAKSIKRIVMLLGRAGLETNRPSDSFFGTVTVRNKYTFYPKQVNYYF